MRLTDIKVKQEKPREKTFMLSDGRGLALEVRSNGKKYWVVRYYEGNRERRKSLGVYPTVTLKEARAKNDELRKALETGKPIGFDRETFATVAAEWIEKRMRPKATEGYLRTIRLRLDRWILPAIGHMKLDELTSGAILQLCRKIEAKGIIETAARVKIIISQVFNYAIATDRADVNPTLALHGALQSHQVKHHSTITEPGKVGLLMRHIDEYPFEVVRYALKFSALVFCRPGEIRAAEWKEIDWKNQEWNIPAEKMKMKRPHIVPLARQTIEVLETLREYTGKNKWLFPSARGDGRYMSENTIRMALRAMGYGNEDMTAHGFRAMASTSFNEARRPDGSRLWSEQAIERQLAHAERNKVMRAYNHAEYLPERRELMQWYADWLDDLKLSVAVAS